MWFRILSLVIAAAFLAKATFALTMPRRFYRERQRQYASVSLPPKLVIPPVVVGALTLTAWYSTFFHYRAWGWLVTVFLTVLSCLAMDHLFRWKKHRHRMLKVVSNPAVWRLDCLLLLVGFLLLTLAFLVY